MQYVKIDGDLAIIAVSGEMDLCTWPVLEEEINNAMSVKNCSKIKIDFAATNNIDSCSIGEIVRLRQKFGNENISLSNIHGIVKDQFICSNLLNVFRVTD